MIDRYYDSFLSGLGFHLYEHARHFLTSCRRILGLKYTAQAGGYIGVEYNGRMVAVTISHIGIEPPFVERLSVKDQVMEETHRLKELYRAGEKTIIVGIDQVERLKGINLKFIAIEQFLKTYPEYRNKIQVVQVPPFATNERTNCISYERRLGLSTARTRPRPSCACAKSSAPRSSASTRPFRRSTSP